MVLMLVYVTIINNTLLYRERVPCSGEGIDEGAGPEDHAQEGPRGESDLL